MRKLLILLFLLLSFSSFASDCLSDVSTSVTDDGKVLIAYTLTSSDPTNTFPVFSINFTGEIAGKKPFALKTLEGAGKTGVILGEGTYTSVWNTIKDGKKKASNAISISVEAQEVTDEATYLCLNLKTFKMCYQNDPPDVKKSTCKTKELWLRRIEPGTFMMGSPEEELGRNDDEIQHEVTLTKAFYIGVFETTQKQFKTITGYNYSVLKGATRPVDSVSYGMLRGDDKGANWPENNGVDEYFNKRYINVLKNEYHIVSGFTFFNALRNKTGNDLIFDLPTEAQWEYACRAGTTTALNDGNNLTNTFSDGNLNKLALYYSNGGYKYKTNSKKSKWDRKWVGHAKVGSYLPNAWGLYDMHGNVEEWCLDCYQAYSKKTATDPVGATNMFGIAPRVKRGGSWFLTVAENCRSARRDSVDAGINCGFRVALVSAQDKQIQKDFEFDIESSTENTLPVFEVKLYGQLAGGLEYPLEEIGKLEYDGASGIVIGKGKHKLTWIPSNAYTNLFDEVKLRVEYEDVTSQATYLVLDLPSNKMRTSISGPYISNDKCRTDELWLKRIEPGIFTMGSPEDELGRGGFYGLDEIQHQVILTKAYYIGVFEATQKQYELITGSNPAYYKGDARPVECVSYDMLRGEGKGSKWPENNEVNEKSFLGLLRKRAGNIFDLPTEAQWEYACRAGTTTALNSGKDLTKKAKCPNMDEVGRYKYNQDDGKVGYSEGHTKVGSYLPNAWGLYDMHGNVEEWCLDCCQAYSKKTAIDPKGSEGKLFRVIRGGCWNSDASSCRSAYRYCDYPYYGYDDYGRGFRIVLVQ